MKKSLIFTIFCVLVLINSYAFATVGTCTQALSDTTDVATKAVTFKTLTFICTADVSAATYPSTAVNSANMAELLGGWMLLTGSSLNGATGPTAGTLITLSTATEGDILGGAGKTPTAATAALANKFTPLTDTGYATSGMVPITGNLTLALPSGNAVNSAITTIVFKFVK